MISVVVLMISPFLFRACLRLVLRHPTRQAHFLPENETAS